MGIRAAFACGTVLSFTVGTAWSWTADAIVGSVPPPRLGPGLFADYAQLADSAAGGSGIALYTVIAVIYATCFAVSGLRAMRRETAARPEGSRR